MKRPLSELAVSARRVIEYAQHTHTIDSVFVWLGISRSRRFLFREIRRGAVCLPTRLPPFFHRSPTEHSTSRANIPPEQQLSFASCVATAVTVRLRSEQRLSRGSSGTTPYTCVIAFLFPPFFVLLDPQSPPPAPKLLGAEFPFWLVFFLACLALFLLPVAARKARGRSAFVAPLYSSPEILPLVRITSWNRKTHRGCKSSDSG